MATICNIKTFSDEDNENLENENDHLDASKDKQEFGKLGKKVTIK